MHLRNITNNLATGVITTGGIGLIIIVVGIILFIFYQALPLWQSAKTDKLQDINIAQLIPSDESVVYAGEEEQKEILYVITQNGRIYFVNLSQNKLIGHTELTKLNGHSISSAAALFGTHRIALGTNHGEIAEIDIKFSTLFESNGRTIVPEAVEKGWYRLHNDSPITRLEIGHEDDRLVFAGVQTTDRQKIFVARTFADTAALQINYLENFTTAVTALTVNSSSSEIIFGFGDGFIERRNFDGNLIEHINVSSQAVTALKYLIGDITLIAGDARGNVTGWMVVGSNGTAPTLTKFRTFETHAQPIQTIAVSWRNKSFITADASGVIHLNHSTTEQTLLNLKAADQAAHLVNFSPKSDGILILNPSGIISNYQLTNAHPEATFKTLFGKVWYESYPDPSYTWQSTGGTDDFEPKISMIPLIFGTLKGTLYAMVFAIPLAIFGAIYTSQFAHPRIRTIIKPAVEIMAALPSVVIGFIAGLWLAPLMKNVMVEFIVMLILTPLLIFFFFYGYSQLPRRWTSSIKQGYEVFMMIPVLILAGFLCYQIGYTIESGWFGGDIQTWLYQTLDIRYDQRNAIIVGIAMAFAVMPIIFTITEDSLSSVPAHLTSASLALGASRWQTAVKVVLPAASAGIFSAVMIGFGRAVGETMIVLMATGNTPIMDWSIFNGMRTLSANIAVEIPEAPHGGTLYRVLFLSGALLFIMTFIVNTVAEIVRQRLRKKYATM
ncbi:ABC transporter permease subunit [bacterium]|nr:ABC transporter permease subunit [bacterium]